MSREKAATIVWDILSVILQIGGFFLAFVGLWIIILDVAGGFTPAVNDVGPSALISGIVAFAAGVSMDVVQTRRVEQSYLLPSSTDSLPAKPVSSPGVPRKFSCPSCGYENDDGGFFCIACNSPLWPVGKPVGSPPPRAMVMRRVGRVLMVRKIKRITLYVILALAVSAPFATSLAVGYSAVSDSRLVLAFTFTGGPGSTAYGDLIVAWMIYSPGFDVGLSTSSTTLSAVYNNTQLPVTSCGDSPANLGKEVPWGPKGCFAMIYGVHGAQLNGTKLSVSVSTVTGLFLYRQQVTRSTSMVCDYRCFASEGPWIY